MKSSLPTYLPFASALCVPPLPSSSTFSILFCWRRSDESKHDTKRTQPERPVVDPQLAPRSRIGFWRGQHAPLALQTRGAGLKRSPSPSIASLAAAQGARDPMSKSLRRLLNSSSDDEPSRARPRASTSSLNVRNPSPFSTRSLLSSSHVAVDCSHARFLPEEGRAHGIARGRRDQEEETRLLFEPVPPGAIRTNYKDAGSRGQITRARSRRQSEPRRSASQVRSQQ